MSIRDGDGPPLRREDAKQPAPARPDDLRATPFTEDVFDDDYYGRRRGRGSSFGLIAAVVFGAAVAAAAGWYVLGTREPSVTTADGGSAKLVKADPNPYKVKPEDPGGLQVENQDKLVYDRLNKAAPPNRVENLLPDAEQPKAPPMKKAEAPPAESAPAAPPQPPQPTASGQDDPLAKLVAKVEPDAAKPSTPPPAPAKAETAAPPTPAPAAKAPEQVAAATSPAPMTPAAPKPKAEAPLQLGPAAPAPGEAAPAETKPAPAAPLVPEASAPAAAAPAAAPATVATAAPSAPPAASATPGSMFLQLASARSEDAALGEWKRISGKNSDVLGGLSPTVMQVDLGEKGTYYRLRAGPVADKTTADGLCATLASRNVGCIVVKP